ncbi:hypothetical protein [Salinactinospora qingdaonensis]|uniref:Lipoprotein n=1 Tax=Salinactinospora qingdaonensis TaxID=702744 RepID=A0ABP7G3I8_9ACTN
MRTVRAVAVACSLVILAGCGIHNFGAAAGGPASSAEPPPTRSPLVPSASPSQEASVFVYNTHDAERGTKSQRPRGLTLSEFTTVTDMQWRSWGGQSAAATGRLSGTWCLPACQEEPYDVTIEVSAPTEVAGTTYYTEYTFAAPLAIPSELRDKMYQADDGTLMLPGERRASSPPSPTT